MANNDAHIELERFWPYRAIVLADQISRYTLSVVREQANMNLSQWRVLAAVAEKPGRTAAEVTTVTPMDKTIVSRAVSSLIDSGLILKRADAADKRRLSLTPTERGQAIYHKIAVHLNAAMVNGLEPGMGSEDFVKTLQQYSQHMQTISPKGD